MNLFILNEKEMNEKIAREILDLVKDKPSCVLGLATGSSPLGVYEELAILSKKENISFKDVTTFNLDEYVGLNPSHNQSYRYFMNDKLFSHIDIPIQNTNVPDGINYQDSMDYYDQKIALKGGIDIQLLGIGSNGHIAFNEPGTSCDSFTHVVDLKESTIKDNARFFDSINDVPRKAITMGLASIMQAKKIILIAKGKNKALAIRRLFTEGIDISLPASILKKHDNVDIYCDEEAASLLKGDRAC